VQGVGFRWSVRRLADSLGLSGWVRNRDDGTVEAEAEGTEAALTQFEARLATENPAARVDSIESRTEPPQGGSGFRIDA
jgi:acylphosphatase